MRLPIFKKLQSELDIESMTQTLEVLEVFAEIPGVKEEELEVIGELMSNLAGAIEMKLMVQNGMNEKEAANTFMQRVMGSIDR